jgi:signal transduction histidine kinase
MVDRRRWPITIVNLGATADLDERERTTRRVFTGASLFVGVAAPIWGVIYISFGELGPGLIPTSYSVVTFVSFIQLWRTRSWAWFRMSQITLIFVLPIALMWSLGGYAPGSAVIIWSVLAPLGALWGGRSREGIAWAVAFIVAVVLSGIVDSSFRGSNELPDPLITTFFVLNLTSVMGLIFLLLGYFVRQKDDTIATAERNLELESELLEQQIALRHSDRLATLGKLSAGMAHELNNPTAAVQQATHQLTSSLLGEEQLSTELARLQLDEPGRGVLEGYAARINDRAHQPEFLDPLERSDREDAVQQRLEAAGVADAWEIAPALVGLGLREDDLDSLAGLVPAERLGDAAGMLAMQYERRSLLGSLDESADRIIEIVRALKSYTHLDQAARQPVDVHEGLDSTLVVLQSRLRDAIEVRRSYADDMPLIEAYGSELNQVWTNILDNAIDAMEGHGVIEIATRVEPDQIVVELTDDGPGIPPDVAPHVFDPFVTTKAPGEGTGLGLNISYNIITEKHCGTVTLESDPGRTTFVVRLPIVLPPPVDEPKED